MKTLAIIGAGHLGQQIAHYAIVDKHYGEVVFFDDFSTDQEVNEIPVLGKTNAILAAFQSKQFDELLIGVGYKHLAVRKEMFDTFSKQISFGTLVHSSAWVDSSATIEHGCVIYPGCVIDAKVIIGANTILNIGCTVAHDTKIGKHCFLSPSVAIAGFATIGEQSIIGINATVIDNIKIAAKTQIGGAALVIRSIDKSGLYVGNPAKFIRE